jgi:hypothetical protein
MVTEAYTELVTKGTSMTEGHSPGKDAESFPPEPEAGGQQLPSSDELFGNSLAPAPGQETADAVVIYPRDRYLAARRGETPREEFARDLVRHVQAQSRRVVAVAAQQAIRHS